MVLKKSEVMAIMLRYNSGEITFDGLVEELNERIESNCHIKEISQAWKATTGRVDPLQNCIEDKKLR